MSNKSQSVKLIIFDLDDTLVDTSDLYWKVREAFIQYVLNAKYTRQQLEDIFEEIDTRNTKKFGYIPQRYEYTMVDMCVELKLDINEEQKLFIQNNARRILNEVPVLIPGALELLDWAKGKFKMALMTRGIDEIQNRKIQKYNLSQYFGEAIEIVDSKDETKFIKLIERFGVMNEQTVVIGDSIKAEINPALNIGAKAIHYKYAHHTYKWLQEHVDSPINNKYFIVTKLSEVREIIEGL